MKILGRQGNKRTTFGCWRAGFIKTGSQDIIRGLYTHFRVQMNCVLYDNTVCFYSNKTTSEMKMWREEDFEYVLLCNKICRVSIIILNESC